ncbi:MAG: D-alanine--D-alanine ligase [Bacteroidia bacterium]|nr:D-alanine--D-alanine ligase [Bacteroidia bacterium]MDW8158841.1 D-alanine--D-alanine ligase [Bacteroidia bacterium]
MTIRVGILMGGSSREKEISFAGGRTVFDNLDRTYFLPIPIFIDSFNQCILLDWRNLYKGSIPDFFPPYYCLPTDSPFQQHYAHHICWPDAQEYKNAQLQIGVPIAWQDLASQIDFAFLTLHGPLGEDGTIQGILEWLGIPYSGSGILGSAFAIDKILQKKWLPLMGFATPPFLILNKNKAFPITQALIEKITQVVGFPCIIKSPNQGSSIGVAQVKDPSELLGALQKAFFTIEISLSSWRNFSIEHKISFIQRIMDERYEIGFPLLCNHTFIQTPEELFELLETTSYETLYLTAHDAPENVIIEQLIEGTEFSVIVIETPEGTPFALPPTQINKPTTVYDYRAKYLPGIASKKTPMPASQPIIEKIRTQAQNLMQAMQLEVYARLDGLLQGDEKNLKIFFNDPNTTSGMLPGSFLFHQAAEVGLSPTNLLTYLIYRSLQVRAQNPSTRYKAQKLLDELKTGLLKTKKKSTTKKKIAIIVGGPSSERHISVEGGRNVFQKLNSAGEYEVTPIFLLHSTHLKKLNVAAQQYEKFHIFTETGFSLWQISIASLLKDNADDIAWTIYSTVLNPEQVNETTQFFLSEIQKQLEIFSLEFPTPPKHIPFQELKKRFDFVFLALHGRPGEDGTLQALLEENKIPFNGAGSQSTRITIDKYLTTEILKANGLKTPAHVLLTKNDWIEDAQKAYEKIETTLTYPLIAKPIDDGCSSGVLLLQNREQLVYYCYLLFKKETFKPEVYKEKLNLGDITEWQEKNFILFEEYLRSNQNNSNETIKEITIGFFTKFKEESNVVEYIVFEPSEVICNSAILSLEEKFLAGEGQNITPARFSPNIEENREIIQRIKKEVEKAARVLGADSYGRFDAFVRVYHPTKEVEVIFLELNALPGITPATCLFHQVALANLTPLEFFEKIIEYGMKRNYNK